jgi:hypothetical protein
MLHLHFSNWAFNKLSYSKVLRIFKNSTIPIKNISFQVQVISLWLTPAAWPITGNNSILMALKNLFTVLAVEMITA